MQHGKEPPFIAAVKSRRGAADWQTVDGMARSAQENVRRELEFCASVLMEYCREASHRTAD